jgi:hypothetical protein
MAETKISNYKVDTNYLQTMMNASATNQVFEGKSHMMNNLNYLAIGFLENKRNRNIFTEAEIQIMESVFEQTHYPDAYIREQLSFQLNQSVSRIQVWFQNRRAKYRKQENNKNKSSKFSKLIFINLNKI